MADPRAVVRQLVDAINAHDPGAAVALFADDARVVAASGRVLDPAGLRETLAATIGGFPDMSIEVRRWIVDCDTVVTEEVMAGTHSGSIAGLAPTGRRVTLPMAHVIRVDGDRIVERASYYDTRSIVRQVSGD